MPVELRSAEQAVVARAAAFAREVIDPQAGGWEQDRRLPLEAFHDAADAGLCRLLAPVERDGHGLGATAAAAVMEELAAGDLAFAFSLVVHNNLIATICRHGDEATIDEQVPSLLAGERLGAFLLTEPGAGSDAAAVQTSARRMDGGWVLDGEKAWVTNATEADLLSVYAQTDPSLGSRGIACLLVDAGQPGVRRLAAYPMLGCHATGTGGFAFEDCRVATERVLVPSGQAFRAAMAGIDLARVLVAAMCVGMLRRGLDVALRYARERPVFGGTVGQLQGPRWMLADVATDLAAARGLAEVAAQRLDAGVGATVAAAHAKKFATRVALHRLADCMQLLGAVGFSHEHPLARHLASAKMAQYLDGTTEIQNVVIARDLFS